jgi:hypothetical protein
MADARVIKVGSHHRACAGLALTAGLRRCGCRYALTFHCSNGLLKPLEAPRSSGDWVLPDPRQSPSTRSLSSSPGGYVFHQLSYLRCDTHHVTDHDDRGRADALLCHQAFHLFQC